VAKITSRRVSVGKWPDAFGQHDLFPPQPATEQHLGIVPEVSLMRSPFCDLAVRRERMCTEGHGRFC
jgi:hypothetical protein